jgi:GNAT superfamily N-acetyltransferase
MNSLRIRPMRPDEISIAVNGATAEGWNPGLADDACFAAADPESFFIGELKGALAATVSCVNYGASFALLHFYTVRKDLRGRGYGLRIWNAAIAHAGPRVTGSMACWRSSKTTRSPVRARLWQRPAVG